ncbi:MAG: GatB/YqeY domain-containing protein, partial [Caldisericaceae bacterium]|nr:GatB/YqeY domain-containing protein [Caldisericaceae bacterium]
EMSDNELSKIIEKVISEISPVSFKQMGFVMRNVITQVKGRASNDRISKIVKRKLSESINGKPSPK